MSEQSETRESFLARLIDLTKAGEIPWEIGSRDYWYKATLPRFTYTISSRDSDDVAPFEFRVYKTGARSSPLEEWDWEFDDNSLVSRRMAELYAAAKVQVMGYENLLEGMFEDLKRFSDEGK